MLGNNPIQDAWREYAKLRIAGNDHALAMAEIELAWPDDIARELDAAGDDWLIDAAWQIAGDDKLQSALNSGDSDLVIQAMSAELRSKLLELCLA
jgi:hypothetical protein